MTILLTINITIICNYINITAVRMYSLQTLHLASLAALLISAFGCSGNAGGTNGSSKPELLNVSYDPTRELWKEINSAFRAAYKDQTGIEVTIKNSHAGSSNQARAVIDGLPADVVTLAMWQDVDAIRKQGLVNNGKPGWEDRLPDRSLPYISTIVFVVRQGNPKRVKDWPDLVREDIEIITPNPKTSGNGKLSFLAAWGYVIRQGGSAEKARAFVREIYRRVPVLDTAARAATTTFSQRKIGDVHLTWENEAYLEVAEAKGALEIVYPSVSIRAEPHVAVVDANTDRKGTTKVAQEYLKFLYTDAGQDILGKHHYRPTNPKFAEKHALTLQTIELFPITEIAKDWDDAMEKFFRDGGVFDDIQRK
jgi:sulfate transport system substrate-binding protein